MLFHFFPYTDFLLIFFARKGIMCLEENKNVKFDERYQHKGCLFDRSTLFLLHFEINLLFVMRVYALDDTSEREKARKEIEKAVKDELSKFLDERYNFHLVDNNPFFLLYMPVDDWLGRTFKIGDKILYAIPKDEKLPVYLHYTTKKRLSEQDK